MALGGGDYTPANAQISMGGGRNHAGFGIDGANGDWWWADFVPGKGDIFAAGSTYDNATRYPFTGVGRAWTSPGTGGLQTRSAAPSASTGPTSGRTGC